MALLFKPFQAGSLSLSNRLVMPPMATAKAEADGKVSQAILDYYAEKSKGGHIGLIIIEHSYIRQDGKASQNQLSIAADDGIQPLKKLAETIHENGSKAIMQINHAGSAASKEVTGTEPVGPSAVVNPRKKKEALIPRELTTNEINDLVTAFQKAAGQVKKAGFDGVEIHSAHGYLLNQFFSPLSNLRTDAYGGAVMNRIHLHLQVIAAIRETVGPGYPVFLRLGAADYLEGGTTVEDSILAAQSLAKAGIDVLDISGGFCGYTIPGVTDRQGYFAPLSEAIKQHVSLPVILTGGITTAQAAEELLAAGKADLIGVGRAILNDSQWAKSAVAT